jgi:hypothetical protein
MRAPVVLALPAEITRVIVAAGAVAASERRARAGGEHLRAWS